MLMNQQSYYNYYFSSDEIEGSSERIQAMNELIYGYLSSHIRPGASVLEVGVGKGFFARVCRDHGHDYHGIEASEEQCARLKEQGLVLTCARVPPLPPLEDRYDLIYSAHLLEHLPDSRAVHELLVQCSGKLEDGGAVAMLFPDAEAMKSEFWNCDYTHCYPTTERRVAQAMADAGLSVVAAHKLNGHYTGGRQLLAKAWSRPVFRKALHALCRDPQRRELYYRGWMYLQQVVLLIARPNGR